VARGSGNGRLVCGWCSTGFHESCKPVIAYYDKKWYCLCEKEGCGSDEGRSSSQDRGTSEDSE
jgi:hypothetical protein